MPDPVVPAAAARPVPGPLRATWFGPAMALLLTAGSTAWLGPLGLAGAGLLAGGGAIGAMLMRRRLRAEVAALMAGPLGLAVQRPLHDAGSPMAPDVAASGLLQPVEAGLQRVLARQQTLFARQAAQLEALRQQVHTDALTGLPNRRHFMATLEAHLADDAAPVVAGLLLLRVQDLQGMNQRIGHIAADHVLQALAQSLQAYPARIDRCCAGRLNGADFALMLPVAGLAVETAQALVQALRGPIQRIDPMARVAAGGVELRGPLSGAQALALADAALARAETGDDNAGRSIDADAVDIDLTPPGGESSWQRRIGRALVQGHVGLGAYPVRTADGRQLHLDCPLRLQLQPDGPLEPASRWLSLATRSRLCAAADEKALALALAAISRDGIARCVNVSAQSVDSAEFVAAVARRLKAEPALACRLWIDLPETLALERPLLVRELSQRWRPLGVMLGLEHAGEGLARIPRLIDLGLDCIRIDSRFVNGIAGEDAGQARQYLQGLVTLVQSMGLQVSAEGVRSAEDLEQLWAMGFDAATGPALAAEPVVAA